MANGSPETDTPLAPNAGASDYERDFYSWALEQARLVREGRWTAIDQENVAEEIESLGREQFAKLRSALRIILIHMLKWDHQPARRSRSWATSISNQRSELFFLLEDSPSLRNRLEEATASAYRRARMQALQETGLTPKRFPESCPYTFDEITAREFRLP
jgi:hypothetical protein